MSGVPMNTPLSNPTISISSPPIRSAKIQLRLKNNPTFITFSNRFRISTPNFALPLSKVTFLPRISSQFGSERKAGSRRNHLREKIIEKQQLGGGNFVGSSENEAIGGLSGEERLKLVGESERLRQLESWADQYNKDVELWGVGSSPIFTVFEDLDGNVEKVLVNKDEIRARGVLEEDFKKVNLRIFHGRLLAKEFESGKSVIPKNSTVAKFVISGKRAESVGILGLENLSENSDNVPEVKELDVIQDEVVLKNSQLVESNVETGFVTNVRTAVFQLGLYPKLSIFGILGLSGLLVLWAAKSVIAAGQFGKMTTLEKGDAVGNIKSDKDDMVKVSVEVVDDSPQGPKVHIRRPRLDKKELLKKMTMNKAPTNVNLQLQKLPSSDGTEVCKLDETMSDSTYIAKLDRESEETSSLVPDDGKKLYTGVANNKMIDLNVTESSDLLDAGAVTTEKAEANSDGDSTIVKELEVGKYVNKIKSVECDATETGSLSGNVVRNNSEVMTNEFICDKKPIKVSDFVQDKENCLVGSVVQDGAYHYTSPAREVTQPEQSSSRKKVRIIKSVKEAREYLSRKCDKQDPLDNRTDTLTKEGASSSWLHNETPIDGIDIVEEASPAGILREIQLNEKTDHCIDNYYDENESSVVSLTATENQTLNLNDEGLLNNSILVSHLLIGGDQHCSKTDNVGNHTGFSDDNIDPILGGVDHAEQTYEPLSIGDDNSISNNDKLEQPEIMPKSKDPEGTSSAAFVIKESSKDLDKILFQGVPDVTYEDHRYGGAYVPQDGMPAQTSYINFALNEKENNPATDLKHIHAAPSGFDTPFESISPPESNQTPEQNPMMKPHGHNDHWLEKNFNVLDPVVAKIRDGFRENYMAALEKTEEAGTIFDLSHLEPVEDDTELQWMEDEHLRDIVFKVRDNELSGREPFHLMTKEDEAAFFGGLQKKVEQENKKLSKAHEYIHSNVENLHYGADGISIYDPPEKFIPRWKGPPVEKAPEFLSNPLEKKDTMVNGNTKSTLSEKSRATSPLKRDNGSPRKPNIIIEGSDGSVKPGKKNGKEFWQHTKKWPSGFLELYNAETDPEVKAAMKDMGKDLDRWITEEEIQEAAEWIEKMPERNKDYIQKKVDKIKREMELFGPQAVVSKYREYSEEKEEDYLWWLDLPYVLCIEMYTSEGEEQKVGFYSLEMATDLELEPKPCHVIAFEDSKDCKNMCYIIQAHLEMLGSGLAFVVARPPKDTFRESKANGFNVTVIRKGELSLNIDQMLEEVEEQIVEIGSKMYHDQIIKERGVDMNALMKGVIGDTKPIRRKRTRRRKLKNSSTN